MTRAIEIASFKLKSSLGAEDFVKANADVEPWLRHQPGFVSRIMVEQSDGMIVDMVIWESAAEAEDSAQRLMKELAGSPVHDVIDQRTVSWSIGRIFHELA
jgi:hypothetical protein